jgi:acyl-coenzyme A thioesterase PaaI-like protein
MFEFFQKLVVHPLKFRLFLLSKLPAAYFSGVRIRSFDRDKAEVTVPFKWFTTNPFRSTYFACLSMAAEMSTGALAMAHLYKRHPPVSMLITATSAEFLKKATGKTTFLCEDGAMIKQAILECVSSGQAEEVVAKSTGRNQAGDIIAVFTFTWSFKIKVSRT